MSFAPVAERVFVPISSEQPPSNVMERVIWKTECPLRADAVEKLGVQSEAGKLAEHLPARTHFFERGFLTPGSEGRYSKILARFRAFEFFNTISA